MNPAQLNPAGMPRLAGTRSHRPSRRTRNQCAARHDGQQAGDTVDESVATMVATTLISPMMVIGPVGGKAGHLRQRLTAEHRVGTPKKPRYMNTTRTTTRRLP